MAERDVNAPDADGLTPLHRAADKGSFLGVHTLLKAGARPNVCTRDGVTPLHLAADRVDSGEVVTRLLDGGANPNMREAVDGHTPLHRAVLSDSAESVNRLLQRGADPNARDGDKGTPLHFAASASSPAVVSRLLGAGANPNARDVHGDTPLHDVASVPRDGSWPASLQTVERLIAGGAKVNARNDAGNTPLHAVAEGRTPRPAAMVQALLRRGADPALKNAAGRTAIEVAAQARDGQARVNANAVREALTQHRCEHKAAPPHTAQKETPTMGKSGGFAAKVNAYDKQFAERMIEALKKVNAPWQKPWAPGEQQGPQNFSTGRSYRGGNALFLTMAGEGYGDPRWGGYRQIADAGGHVRKGEKGTPVLFVDIKKRTAVMDENGAPKKDADGHPQYKLELRDRPMVKMHMVFNVEQTERLKLPALEKKTPPEWEAHKRVEAVMRGSGVDITNKRGDKAYYSPSQDKVVLPERDQFPSQAAYSHTALHELAHATGHPSRLDRPSLNKHNGFGTEMYAREELRAEMAAMMAGERLGVGHEPRHGTAYVASWIKALESNPKEIRLAASDAQKASDWMTVRELALTREQEKAVERGERKAVGELPEPPRTPGVVPPAPQPAQAPSPGQERTVGPEL